MSQPLSPEEAADRRFDRRMRVLMGIITVLGATATTIMQVVEAERSVRREKSVKGTARTVKKKSKKALPTPKRKLLRRAPLRTLRQIEHAAQRLKKTADELSISSQHQIAG